MSITANILGGAVQLTGNPVWIKLSGANQPDGTTDSENSKRGRKTKRNTFY